jgi:hypothetical protein
MLEETSEKLKKAQFRQSAFLPVHYGLVRRPLLFPSSRRSVRSSSGNPNLGHRQTFTLITSKWWSKVQTGAPRRALIAASTVSNRVRSWFRYGRIVTEAS